MAAFSYQAVLLEEFEYRKSRNAGYSMRAFARDLSMAPSSLNEVLGGTKGLSPGKASKLTRRLGMSDDIGELFVLSARAQHARAAVDREAAAKELAARLAADKARQPRTQAIVNWVVEAVLKLSERTTELDPEATARSLDVPPSSVRFALRYLARLGFLEGVSPSRAFLAYLGKGRRVNVEYSQLLKRAQRANAEPLHRDRFWHEPLLLDVKATRAARQLIDRCFEDIKRLETTSSKTTLFYLTTQFFQVETKGD